MVQPDLIRLVPAAGVLAMLAAFPAAPLAQDAPVRQAKAVVAKQPGELGKVAWLRDEAAAQKQAKASGKPVLVLFQEVPG